MLFLKQKHTFSACYYVYFCISQLFEELRAFGANFLMDTMF